MKAPDTMKSPSTAKPPGTMRRSIYLQLLLVITASLILALVVVGAALYRQIYNDEKLSLLEKLNSSGELLANRTIAALLFDDYAAVKTNISSARLIPSVIKICVYQQANLKIADYLRPGIDSSCEVMLKTAALSQRQYIDEQEAWALIPVQDGDKILGHLKIVASTDLIKAHVHRALLAVGTILFVAMLIALALGSSLLRRTLSPLKTLGRDVKRISEQPFSTYRPARFYNDEVGDLVGAFNSMLDALAHENRAQQQSEKRFRILAENSPVGIYLRNAKGELEYANAKWSEIAGIELAQIDVDFAQFIAEEDYPQYQKMLAQVHTAQVPAMMEYSYRTPAATQPKRLMEYVAPVIKPATDEDAAEVVSLIGSILDISELKHAQIELERLALYDPLTNLPNRRFFHDHLHYQIAAAAKHNQSFAILMIDLDNFKRVNDTMGHDAGDYLLKVLGQRLYECCFAEDVISRLGGDEFIVLLNNQSKVVISQVVERLQAAIGEPVVFQNRTIEIRSSMGVAVYPDDASNARDLLKSADIALYRAKAVGRNCMVFFSPELDQAVQERVALEIKLQSALKNQKLFLYLQPQVDARSKRAVWCEALLRWRDEEYGFVSPAQFIPIAEESGLIVEIGNWVLRETCRLWSEHGRQLMEIGIQGISVNLSARQFYAKNLVGISMEILQQFAVSPRHIAFEITESLVMEDVDAAILTLRELRRQGFQISMDDFGTGYSSLSYLKQFTIDYLKIDKSFVDGLPHDPNDMAITSAIIAMAQQLGIGVVAEGIETEQQMQVLVANGCQRMQGYFFSRPLPIEDLLANQKLKAIS